MKDIAFFQFSTEEDFSYVLEFSGLVLTGRDFEIKIKDRASDTTRVTLTNGSGITISGTNVLEAAYAKAAIVGWARGEYSADVVDVTGGTHSRIMAVRFVLDLPGRLVQGVRDRKAFINWSPNQALVTATGAIGPTGPVGPQGDQGDEGWAPALAVISDGARRVLQVADWVGGAGAKPATGAYVGATGLVSNVVDAVDIRGPQGLVGNTGSTGAQGDKGWSPVLAVVSDAGRRVLQVSDWAGGAGTKPASGSYVGASGLTSVLADAIDIRGDQGPPGSVADGNKGDVTVSSGGTAWAVNNDAVTNAKLANMAANTIKGRITGSTGDPEDLTAANVRTITGQTEVSIFDQTVAGSASTGFVVPLGSYKRLKIKLDMIVNTAVADLSVAWRISRDGGSTYDAGASDYLYRIWGAVAATATGFTSNGALTNVVESSLGSVTTVVDASFNAGSAGAYATMLSTAYFVNPTSNAEVTVIGSNRQLAGAATHLYIFSTTASGFAIDTRLQVWGS